MSQKRKRSPDSDPPEDCNTIFRSSTIEDRSSTFIGYFSPTFKPKDLQRKEDFSSASHKILAWRRESNQQAITGKTNYITGSDDDGEKFAGKKVEKVLESMQVSGACVVARWYGGVLLGPVRFTHIEECAKGAVRSWLDAQKEEKAKKLKQVDDEKDRTRLAQVLVERDQSIMVLRKLAAEKEDQIKGLREDGGGNGSGKQEAAGSSQTQTPLKPPIDYESMPVEKLRVLEKARDATLTFLLKRIDKAEGELGAAKSTTKGSEDS